MDSIFIGKCDVMYCSCFRVVKSLKYFMNGVERLLLRRPCELETVGKKQFGFMFMEHLMLCLS